MLTPSRKHSRFPYTLHGINVTLYLHRDRLIIHPKGYICQMRPAFLDDGAQEVPLRYVQNIELNNQLLVVTLHDEDAVYVLFAPQDEHNAEQLAHTLLNMLSL